MHLSFILTLSPLHLCFLLLLYLSSQFVMKLVNKLLYRCAALASYSMIPAFGYILKFLHFVFQRILVLTNKCVNCIMTLCFWSRLRIRVSQFCAGYTISENYTQQRCNE